MKIQDKSRDLNFWDKAVRLYKSMEISISNFCERNKLEEPEFEKWLKHFCYTSDDREGARQFKETSWKLQPIKYTRDPSSPTGLAFTGRETVCEVVLKNGRQLFFHSSISEESLHKLITVLELKK